MQISKSTIEELIEVVKEEYGQDLNYEQASKLLRDWVGYFSKLAELNYRQNNDNQNSN